MEFTYQLRGLPKLQAAVKAAPGLLAVKNKEAMGSVVNLVRAEIEKRMPEGPGHFGDHAKASYSSSVSAERNGTVVGHVGNPLPQARWREFGTKAHDIGAKSGKPLAFQMKGHSVIVSSVHHPGEKKRPIMRPSVKALRPQIIQLFMDAVDLVSKSMATKGD